MSFQINKKSATPIYVQIKDGFMSEIQEGQLKPGAALPSENELADRYNVSPMTIRHAMSELVNAGYIYRERGRGTFVSTTRLKHQLETLTSFSEDMQQRDMQPGSRLLSLEQLPRPDHLNEYAAADVQFTRIKRLRFADGQPVAIHDSYVSSRGVTIDGDALAAGASLYDMLESQGVFLSEAIETIEAQAASPDDAELLGIKNGAPLLCTTRYSWDDSGNFVEYVVALYLADLYQYTIRLKRA
ncbi:MAG: GntR family transcriptional regulator [Chloroflexota bacterium]